MTLLWWHWLLVGLALMVAELVTPGGFFFIFFASAALIIGLIAAVGASGPAWLQFLLFSVLSVGSLLLFRKRLLARVQSDPQRPSVDQLIGAVGVATEDLAPGQVGRVELRGAGWSARNAGSEPLARGARCRVVGVDGLLLFVDAEER
jgi:membrane protein implicated in regulation of membrane protease activity